MLTVILSAISIMLSEPSKPRGSVVPVIWLFDLYTSLEFLGYWGGKQVPTVFRLSCRLRRGAYKQRALPIKPTLFRDGTARQQTRTNAGKSEYQLSREPDC
jgi:hypothetical protein